MAKIIKKYFWVFIVLFSIIRVLLILNYSPYLLSYAKYDDSLMFDIAKSIASGHWLGVYNEYTLSKGFIYPLIVSLFTWLKMPYVIGYTLLYIFACYFLTTSISKIVTNKIYLLLMYVILLFNPISYAIETFLRFYRNGINISLIMIFFALLIRLYTNKGDIKKSIIYSMLTGFMLFVVYNMRQDAIWVIPALLIILVSSLVYYIKNNKRFVFIPMIPIILMVILSNISAYINYANYGIYTNNTFENSNFTIVRKQLISIEEDKFINRVSVSMKTLEKVATLSPTFNTIYNEVINSKLVDQKTNEIIDGYITFSLIDAHMKVYPKSNAVETNSFWKKVSIELNNAFDKNLLKKRFVIPISGLAPPRDEYYGDIINNYMKTVIFLYKYDDIKIDYACSTAEQYRLDEFNKFTFGESKTVQEKTTYNNTKVSNIVLNAILQIYKLLAPIITLYGLLSYFVLVYKKEKNMYIPSIMFISMLLYIGGIAYIETSSVTKTISYFYLAPLYPMLLFVCLFNSIVLINKNKEK